MTAETTTATRLRIAAYTAADRILAAEIDAAGKLSHEALRRLLVMAYLDGHANAGNWVQEILAEVSEEAGR
jgi:hypothetical protein